MNVKNLQIVIDMLKSMPNETIDLSQWASPCGTVMCVCGEVAHRGLIPGFELHNEFPQDGASVKYNGMLSWAAVAEVFDFEVHDAKSLFSAHEYQSFFLKFDIVKTSDIIEKLEDFISGAEDI